MKLTVIAVVLFVMLVALFTQTNAALTTKAIKSTLVDETEQQAVPKVKMSTQGREFCYIVAGSTKCKSMGCTWTDAGCRP
eukprot:UN00119